MKIIDAIQSLRPSAQWVLRGDDLEWLDAVQTQPTEAEITAEVTRLQAEYDAQEYARSRATEYPSLADFADAYYWAQKGDNTLMDAYVAKCDDVKTKYPKV
tara:strand:+ start:2269 stop:2571 length:303 start_codon:yes stop_codon:yes gene_type:complete